MNLQGFGVGLDMQLVVLVIRVEGKLFRSGYFRADNIFIATP